MKLEALGMWQGSHGDGCSEEMSLNHAKEVRGEPSTGELDSGKGSQCLLRFPAVTTQASMGPT